MPKRIDLYACECVSVCVGRAYVRTFCARQSQTWSRRLSDRRWRHVDWLTFAAFANAQPPTTGNMPLLPPSSSLKLCRSQCAVCVCVRACLCVATITTTTINVPGSQPGVAVAAVVTVVAVVVGAATAAAVLVFIVG